MASNIRNLTGKVLGNCTLERLVGQGGMGAVYLARQLRPSRYVAVKILVPTDASNDELYQQFLARFRREADVIARLEHVNIMPVYEYGEQDGLAYLVMPYLTGGSLRDVLRQRGRLTAEEAATYMDQAAAALDYAHAQGVIHRDLKPANFLLHSDGRLVLADFGIARIMEENNTSGNTLTGIGTILGTPEYMAPEMAAGGAVDYRADIYELGVVLYQMLSGRVPFTGTTPYAVVMQQIQQPLPSLSRSEPGIPAAVDTVIQKATAKQREARYNSTKELAQAYRAAITGAALPANDPYAGPTVVAPGPIKLPPTPQYQYPPTMQQQRDLPNTLPPVGANAQYNQQYAQPVTPYNTFNAPQQRRSQPLLWVLLGLVAILLLIGGTIVGIQISRNSAAGPGTATATVGVGGSTPTAGTTPTTAPTATATTQPRPTPSPTSQPTSPPSAGLPIGAQLYATTMIGQNCDKNGGQWADFNNITTECQGARTKLTNNNQNGLEGTFLTGLPNHNYPADYVIRTQLRPDANSNTDFGVYFRNQPGGNQQGTYTFMIHPDNTWSIYVYDNATAARTQLAQGTLRNAHTLLVVDIAVVGSQFSVYVNNRQLGTINDSTYTSGTAGIAVDQGGIVYVSAFTLYAVAGQ